MMKKLMFFVLVVAVMAGSALAGPVEPYRLAFITSSNPNGAVSSDIADYNSYVQSLANAVPALNGITFNCIGSTADVDARDNTGTNPNVSVGVPIYLVDGTTLVANDNADLNNLNRINLTQERHHL